MRNPRNLLLLLLVWGCSSASADHADLSSTDATVTADTSGTDAADLTSTMVTPLYLTLVSHNERTLSRFGRFRENQADYVIWRNSVIRVATMITQYGARYSWQTDYVILDGIAAFEATVLAADPTKTKGLPILSYLQQELGVSIEPHAHECLPKGGSSCNDKAYNYADLVHVIKTIGGVDAAPIVGGTTSSERTLDQLTACLTGNVFTTVSWCPQALTVFAGAQGGHTGGDDYHSGVWYPSDLAGGFLTHDAAGSLAYIGSGYLFSADFGFANQQGLPEPLTFITETVAKLADGTLPAGITTASVMLIEDFMIDKDQYDALEALLIALKPLIDSGQVIPATYPEVLAIWSSHYANQPNQYLRPQ